MTIASIPGGLWPHFQEYDPAHLDRDQDADLIIQRTLGCGMWEEVRWLLMTHGVERTRQFLRLTGALSKVTLMPPMIEHTSWPTVLSLVSKKRADKLSKPLIRAIILLAGTPGSKRLGVFVARYQRLAWSIA